MKKNEFSTVRLSHLSNEDAASLFVQTCEYAIPSKDFLSEIANVALTNLQTSAAVFSAQANQRQKSVYTEQVQSSRGTSKNLFAEINRTIQYEAKSRDQGKKQAAQNFDFWFVPYADLPRRTIGAQMEQTQEMLAKYKVTPLLKSAAEIIGIDNLLVELEVENKALMEAYKSRTDDHGNRKTSSSDLRPAANESYVQFCNIIEQSANLTPNRGIQKLFNNMEDLRIKHSMLVPKKKEQKTKASA